jgi:hypothetical protein
MITDYGLEHLHNGPDPATACSNWNTIVLRDGSGNELGSIAATVTNNGTDGLEFTGEWQNGATPVTVAQVALYDGVEDCKQDTVSVEVLANQKADVTVTLLIQNA